MDNKFHEHSGKENKCNLKIGWKCRTIYIHCILYNSDLDMLTRALNVDSYGCVHLNVGDGPYDECNNHDPGRNQGGEQMPRRLSILESLTRGAGVLLPCPPASGNQGAVACWGFCISGWWGGGVLCCFFFLWILEGTVSNMCVPYGFVNLFYSNIWYCCPVSLSILPQSPAVS